MQMVLIRRSVIYNIQNNTGVMWDSFAYSFLLDKSLWLRGDYYTVGNLRENSA